MNAVYWIWGTTLAIITFVVVPLALHLLHRTLKAAMSIERYARESLTAGVGIANNTALAGYLIPVAYYLSRTAGHLTKLVSGLKAVRDNAAPLTGHLTNLGGGLTALRGELQAVDSRLGDAVEIFGR